MRVRIALLWLVASVAALALAACGSSEKAATASSPPSATSSNSNTSTQAARGPAFKIGFICSCTGAAAAALAHEGDVMKAWASAVNAAGGINGHPVSVTVEDDANNASQALQAGKKILNANVIAVVDGSLQDAVWAKEITAAGIPVVGGLVSEPTFASNPNFFPSGAVLPAVILGQVIEAKAAGTTHMGVAYCKEVPVCAQLVGLVQAAAGAVGGFRASGQAVSFTQPSYTAPCLALKSSGSDNLFAAGPAPVVVRIADACAQQGYKPLQVNQAGTSDSSWLKDPNMEGTTLVDANAPWFDTSIPAIKQFTDAVNKYAPGVTTSSSFGPNLLTPWAGGQLFAAAAKAAKLTPDSAPADLKAGLYKLKNETLGGLTGPLTYAAGKPAFPACYFVVTVKGGKFTTSKGTSHICPSHNQVMKLTAALAQAAR